MDCTHEQFLAGPTRESWFMSFLPLTRLFGVDIPRISGRSGGMCREVPTLVRAPASAYAAYRLLNWKCVEK